MIASSQWQAASGCTYVWVQHISTQELSEQQTFWCSNKWQSYALLLTSTIALWHNNVQVAWLHSQAYFPNDAPIRQLHEDTTVTVQWSPKGPNTRTAGSLTLNLKWSISSDYKHDKCGYILGNISNDNMTFNWMQIFCFVLIQFKYNHTKKNFYSNLQPFKIW